MTLKKIISSLVASTLIITQTMLGLGCLSATTMANETDSYLSEFFELPLSEIESKLDVSRSDSNTSQIVVSFSNDQLRKLVSELEPQKEEIGNDSELFRKAFFDLLLDKLHLTGIYDVADPEYSNASMPSAWWNASTPFVVEECDDQSEAYVTLLYPDYQEEYTFVNGEERVTVDRYEATQRSLYVINTYGDKDYFGIAFEELTSKSITQPMDTAAENVAYFFELPLSEIESKLDVSRSDSNTSQIVVSFSNDQLRKLVSELEPQKEEIGNDSELFRKAFFDLLLDKLHLTGIYDVADPEYSNASMPSAWWNASTPFVVEECDDQSEAYVTLLYPDYQAEYTFVNGEERVTVDRYEATQRSLYMINTYGDKDYFGIAFEELTSVNSQQIASDDELCAWAENDYHSKHGIVVTATVVNKENGKMTIALINESGETVDTYVVDLVTGIGNDAANTEINLPQTGNNSMTNIFIFISAFMLIVFGLFAVKSSGIIRRMEDEQ